VLTLIIQGGIPSPQTAAESTSWCRSMMTAMSFVWKRSSRDRISVPEDVLAHRRD
jgi:hypothetical protein